jgi:hypothetical protein
MPRKPNYRFERMERERKKAAKKAARAQAKADKAEQMNPDENGDVADDGDAAAEEETTE